MGWARTFLLGDIGNRLDIGDAEEAIRLIRKRARENRSLDRSQQERIELLERENEQQQVLIAALARLLAARGVIEPDELAPFIVALDESAPDDAGPDA